MSIEKATSAVKIFATRKLVEIMEECKGKQIPNMWKFEDTVGFTVNITEGDLNFTIQAAAAPVAEAGPGNFLIRIQSTFVGKTVFKQGYNFPATPVGQMVVMDFPLYAEDEQELTDGIAQIIQDEADNILCQILQ
ncbi:hypothetical protein N1M2_26 [Klebsiella phage N1M2]|uniref:Uncharacterized protein n=1 Tax=Klebsiella phage N1M2 TaxID=2664939 RepID=A0A6B7ZF04_9CAUD|nr:hypothetical protein PQB72_gp026 [Klebsiella phage N1M2]QGH71889.1 hypothetical protein N1M2_26 [Klebsiella phage N1M2]